MRPRQIKLGLVFVTLALTFFACQNSDTYEPGDKSTSFYRSTLADLPACDTAHSGNLAYVTDVSQFYHCDGTAWTVVDISGAPGVDGATLEVVDTNGTRIGDLLFADWPRQRIGIRFDDEAVGTFAIDGRFQAGLCQHGYCTGDMTATAGGVSFNAGGTQSTWSQSYCSYTTADCTGTCWLPDAPLKNSIFQTKDNAFVRATGTETATAAAFDVLSVWRANQTSCVNNTTGAGVCCSNFLVTPTIASNTGVGVSTSYSLDGHPFNGPLYFE